VSYEIIHNYKSALWDDLYFKVRATKLEKYVVLIGGNPVQYYQGNYYVGHNYAQHILALSNLLDYLVFYAHVFSEGFRPSGEELDPNKIKVIPSKFWSVRKNFQNWFSDQRQLISLTLNCIGCIESFPSSTGFISPLYYIKSSAHKILYLKTDWIEQINNRTYNEKGKRIINMIRKLYFRISQEIAVARADTVLVRGRKLLNEYYSKAKNIELAQPIGSFDISFAYKRKDTCLGKNVNLLYIGHLAEHKGVFDLIESVAIAQKMLKKDKVLDLVLIGDERQTGDGVPPRRLQQFANNLGIGKQVVFKGRLDDKQKLAENYRQSDIFLLASYIEGFPRVINEALLHSLPVISTNVGGIPYEFDNKKEVLLVEPGNSESFAKRICEVIEDSFLRKNLIKNGYLWAISSLSEPAWKQHARLLGIQG